MNEAHGGGGGFLSALLVTGTIALANDHIAAGGQTHGDEGDQIHDYAAVVYAGQALCPAVLPRDHHVY